MKSQVCAEKKVLATNLTHHYPTIRKTKEPSMNAIEAAPGYLLQSQKGHDLSSFRRSAAFRSHLEPAFESHPLSVVSPVSFSATCPQSSPRSLLEAKTVSHPSVGHIPLLQLAKCRNISYSSRIWTHSCLRRSCTASTMKSRRARTASLTKSSCQETLPKRRKASMAVSNTVRTGVVMFTWRADQY